MEEKARQYGDGGLCDAIYQAGDLEDRVGPLTREERLGIDDFVRKKMVQWGQRDGVAD